MISNMKAYLDEKTILNDVLNLDHLGVKINIKKRYPLFLLIADATMDLKDYEVSYQRKTSFDIKRFERMTSYFERFEAKEKIIDIMIGGNLYKAYELLKHFNKSIKRKSIDDKEVWLSFEERKYQSWYQLIALSTDGIDTIRLTNQIMLFFSKGRMFALSENHMIRPYLALFKVMTRYKCMTKEELRCLEMYSCLDDKNRTLLKLYIHSNLFQSLLYDLDDFEEANTIINKLDELNMLEAYISLNVQAAKLLGGI
jgi:hypothetical protein